MNKISTYFYFTSIALLLFFSTSCRSAKYLESDQALIVHNEIQGAPNDLKEDALDYISNQVRPNSRINLFIYNLFNTKNGAYKTDRIRNVGEAPNIVDTSLIQLSGQRIQGFLMNKGYFDAKVSPEIDIQKSRASIKYEVDLGTPYILNQIEHKVKDRELREIYNTEVETASRIRTNKQYDLSDFIWQRELAYQKFKNHGYFDYVRQYMQVEIDTIGHTGKADVTIEIDNHQSGGQHRCTDVSCIRNAGDGTTGGLPGELSAAVGCVYLNARLSGGYHSLRRCACTDSRRTYSVSAGYLW